MKKQPSAPVKSKPQNGAAPSENTANPKPRGKAYMFFAHALDSFYALLNAKKRLLCFLALWSLFLNYLLNRIFSAENSINIDFGNKMQNIFDLYDAEFNASTIAKTLQNEGKPHLIKQILQEEKLKFFSQKLV